MAGVPCDCSFIQNVATGVPDWIRPVTWEKGRLTLSPILLLQITSTLLAAIGPDWQNVHEFDRSQNLNLGPHDGNSQQMCRRGAHYVDWPITFCYMKQSTKWCPFPVSFSLSLTSLSFPVWREEDKHCGPVCLFSAVCSGVGEDAGYAGVTPDTLENWSERHH